MPASCAIPLCAKQRLRFSADQLTRRGLALKHCKASSLNLRARRAGSFGVMENGGGSNSVPVLTLNGLSLNDHTAGDDSPCELCDRCQIICRDPKDWSVRWKFLFKLEKKLDYIAPSVCKFCHFFEEVMLEHQRLWYETLPPPTLSICNRSGSTTCLLRILYKLHNRHQVYYVQVTHLESGDDGPPIASSYGFGVSYAKIKLWIREHEAFDPNSLVSGDRLHGMKVIRCDVDPVKVVAAPEDSDYVALSYVWGDSEEGSLKVGDALGSDLPKTIRDSIRVTLELGYKYLWVDRYCIDQQDQTDVHRQIQQMGAIYARAVVTISAVVGDDPSHGLPGVGTLRSPPHNDAVARGVHLRHEWDSIADIQCSKWATRGWTLQESYLSARQLFFTERQVVFACNNEILCEHKSTTGSGFRLQGMLGPGPDGYNDETMGLIKVLEQYSKRQLRYEADALNAVSAILNMLTAPDASYSHLFGIPFAARIDRLQGNYRILLNWESHQQGTRRNSMPSWSPLGWTSRIEFCDKQNAANAFGLKVWTGHEWTEWCQLDPPAVEHLRLNPISGSRYLRVSTLAFRPKAVWANATFSGRGTQSRLCCAGIDKYLFEPSFDAATADSLFDETVLCAVFFNCYQPAFLLLLRPCKVLRSDLPQSALSDLPTYERIGMSELSRLLLYDEDTGLVRGTWGEDERVRVHAAMESEYRHLLYGHEKGEEEGVVDGQLMTFILG